jgi:hypothetical protein
VRNRGSTKAQRKREANAAAAKERRQKVIAFGGLVVLAILLVIQGPKLLDALGGSSDPVAAPSPPAAAVPEAEPENNGEALRELQGSRDPFAARGLGDNDPLARAVSGPAGIDDPFAPRALASAPAPEATPTPESQPEPEPPAPSLPNRIVLGTPKAGAEAKRGWIVVLASIQTRLGRSYAERFAARVQARGLDVAVLDSSTNKPLRSGYYVVYTGPFASLEAVQLSASHVHAFGYRTAYVREILRY